MDIVGIITIFVLPYMAGYILSTLFNKRETGQIETYLIGFFFVLLLQGVVFIGGQASGISFDQMCELFFSMTLCIGVVFALALVCNIIRAIIVKNRPKSNDEDSALSEPVSHRPMSRQEWVILAILIIVAAGVLARVWLLKPYLRHDIMIETVRTTLSTDTINEYNPLTSQPYSLGLIASRKLISLPTYYSYICRIYGIDETLLLFVFLTSQTIMCTYFACIQTMAPMLRNRRKTLIFGVFLGALLLSGDYFSGAIGEKLLWYGYAGDTIVAGVMLPYIMYIATRWYRERRGDYGVRKGYVIKNIAKMLLCLTASVFITGIATGALLILITIATVGACCIVRFRNLGEDSV